MGVNMLERKISKIENSKNNVCEISKSAYRKLRFYKWINRLFKKRSTHQKMLDRSVR
jgi:hypothetical protein